MSRILMVLDHSYPPDVRVENEAESLADAGHEVTILAIGPDDRAAEDLSGRVRIIRDRMPGELRNKLRGLAGFLPLLSLYVAARMAAIHRDWPFDAVHAHDLYLVGGALRGGRCLGISVVADLHENWVAAIEQYAWSTRFPGRLFADPARWKRLERRWLREADAIVVVIEEMAERLAAGGIPSRKITVIPNTIHRARFDAWLDASRQDSGPPASPDGGPVIIYTGGMDRHRGIETAVRAMPRVLAAMPTARLDLVGDGAVRSELESLVNALDLGSAVTFRGAVAQQAIPSVIASADVGLIPHLKSEHTDHTIPHKLFHYMHLGVPVVASDCRPLERILRETDAGRIHRSGDSEGLAAAVLEILSSPELARRLGENGRQAVAETYHWEKTAPGLSDLYDRLPGERRAKRP